MRRRDLGRKAGVGMRILAAVVPDDEGAGGVGGTPGSHCVLLEDARGRVHDAHQVVIREILTDDGAPSIGAEVYVCHR